MVLFNVPVLIERLGNYDIYGQPTLTTVVNTCCSLVKLEQAIEPTPIRADSSGSSSFANETRLKIRILVSPDTNIKLGDKFTVLGDSFETKVILKRTNLSGCVDHFQVDGETWAQG